MHQQSVFISMKIEEFENLCKIANDLAQRMSNFSVIMSSCLMKANEDLKRQQVELQQKQAEQLRNAEQLKNSENQNSTENVNK